MGGQQRLDRRVLPDNEDMIGIRRPIQAQSGGGGGQGESLPNLGRKREEEVPRHLLSI
jgi:hypothetical protein